MLNYTEETLLTIAIPTFNGASTLEETLDSVVSQLQYGVDVLISDNASTDRTAEIVNKYLIDYPQIRYIRNAENIGGDQNYAQAIRYASGRFVWLFSDDDVLEKGSVQSVVNIIKQVGLNFGLIVVDCQVYNFIQNRVLINGLNTVKATYCLPRGSNIFQDPVRDMIGVVSTILVRRQLLEGFDCTNLIGTCHLQIGIAAYLSAIEHSLVLDDKLFLFRRDAEPRWNSLSYNVDFYFGYETAAFFGSRSLETIQHLVERKVWQLPKYLIRVKVAKRAYDWHRLFVTIF